MSGRDRLAQEVAATHATSPRAEWDAPRDLLDAARGLFTADSDGQDRGAEVILAGIARLLTHGPFASVRLHGTATGSLLPEALRPEQQFGPPEADVLLHALAAAAPPGSELWPQGPADPEKLSNAIRALCGRIPCRTVALRATAVCYLLRLVPTADTSRRRWLLRRTIWLLDPRTEDALLLLLGLTGPDDPLVHRLASTSARSAEGPESAEPFPLSSWSNWRTVEGVLRLGGRIYALREHRRLTFADLRWDDNIAQLALAREQARALRTGDLVTVSGTRGTTRTGQPTVFVTRVDRHQPGAGAQEPAAAGPARILKPVRDHLAAAGFLETISPVLTDGYFGGAARPFTTWAAGAEHHQYLRVTTELALLKVIAAGTSRCYEIGASFRNEGLRGQQAKEFLMLEAYAADIDLSSMTEFLVSLTREVADYRGALRQISFDDAFREVSGLDPSDSPAVRALAAERIPATSARTDDLDILARRLWRNSLRSALPGLVAINAIPGPASPLIAGTGRAAERVWLYIDGLEVAEASRNELRPDLLAETFQRQFDRDPHPVHRDYREALAMFDQGIPPCVGIGLSLTRLAHLARQHAAPPSVPSPRREQPR
ncbi:amino acid--tRNA ligase-related protein [Kitasatospora sp. GAS1066B]|uniref:amino acid--tRNA ligase-related protein n=1 Tax=Kitasatospora sp. GAS1066B TaxID=3156271 RepID=UPI003512944E